MICQPLQKNSLLPVYVKFSIKLAVENAWLVPPTYFREAAVTDEVSEVGTDTRLPS